MKILLTGSRLFICFMLLPIVSMAQVAPKLLLECVGTPPQELIENELEKSNKEIEGLYQEMTKKQRSELILESNFALNNFISTGLVCYGDPYTLFLQKMLENIKAGNPGVVPDGINIYTTRDPLPNAFAWRDGNLFVNIGLFGIMQNDAQIAFIICHEIIHYSNEHSKNQFVYNKSLEKKGVKGLLSKEINEDEVSLARNFYSRSLETEADIEGLNLFINSTYNIQEGIKALEQLKKSQNPLISFGLDFISFCAVSDSQIELINEYYIESFADYNKLKEEYANKPTTHPDLNYRIQYIDSIAMAKNLALEAGTIKTKEFEELEKSIPYDLLANEYRAGNYTKVIYKALKQRERVHEQFYNEYALMSLHAIFQQVYNEAFSLRYPTDNSEYCHFYFYLQFALTENEIAPIIESTLSYFNPEELYDKSYFYYCAIKDLEAKILVKEQGLTYTQQWFTKYLDKFNNGYYKSVAIARQ